MIDPRRYGIEEGDRIRISIEGAVEKGDLYDPYDLHVGGIALHQLPTSVPIEPTVEILEKAEPKWWSAQVIKASYMGDHPPEFYLQAELPVGVPTFIDAAGDYYFAPEELRDVEVIVQ